MNKLINIYTDGSSIGNPGPGGYGIVMLTEDGKYIENIEYFSRDDSKVGLTLEFDYDVINKEWNHKGFSSQGDPLHEIWVKRK